MSDFHFPRGHFILFSLSFPLVSMVQKPIPLTKMPPPPGSLSQSFQGEWTRTQGLLLLFPTPFLAFLQQLLLRSALGCMPSHVYTSLRPVHEEGSRTGPGIYSSLSPTSQLGLHGPQHIPELQVAECRHPFIQHHGAADPALGSWEGQEGPGQLPFLRSLEIHGSKTSILEVLPEGSSLQTGESTHCQGTWQALRCRKKAQEVLFCWKAYLKFRNKPKT